MKSFYQVKSDKTSFIQYIIYNVTLYL